MSEDVDPEALQRDLDRIKDAMGIAERYEGATEQWLVFGVAVAVASACSQYVVLQHLPESWIAVIWLGLFAVVAGGLSRRSGYSYAPGSDEPNVGFQVLVAYLSAFAVQFAVSPFLADLDYLAEMAYGLGVILVALGVGYLVAGETLKAHRIRVRDRRAFQVGGLLLVALGVAIPNVEFLHTWGYAVFGGTYLVYAVVSYGVLTRT